MTHSVSEQLMIELINRARMDPLAEAARQGIALDQGLAAGAITGAAKQVLAPNAALLQAADAHSAWMLATATFSHTGAGGSSAGDRMEDAGYVFGGNWSWSENLSFWGSTGGVDALAVIPVQFANLFASAGHRANIFAAAAREIGVGQDIGLYKGYHSSFVTQNFAYSGESLFLTGVAIRDADGDRFYDAGEGRGGVGFAIQGGAPVASAAAGGYALTHQGAGSVTVTVTAGGQQTRLAVNFGAENIKLDVLVDAAGKAVTFLTTGGIGLIDGAVRDVALLGIADAWLGGGAGDDTLTGNSGNSTLEGGAGHDLLLGVAGDNLLEGGAGRDTLQGGTGQDTLRGGQGQDRLVAGEGDDVVWGGAGNDRLLMGAGNDRALGGAGDDTIAGGAGDDTLTGGAGADQFDFIRGNHQNRITDFSLADGDTLAFDARLWLQTHGTLTATQVVETFATLQPGGAAVLDFGAGGTVVTLQGLGTLDGLADALILF
jgi:Ca2+-binding RTX toxin-like protein